MINDRIEYYNLHYVGGGDQYEYRSTFWFSEVDL